MDVFEHLARMPVAYRHFLVERERQQRYERTVCAATDAFAETMERAHGKEVSCREAFMAQHGRHLPRCFHQVRAGTSIHAATPGAR